ncbi:MAG: membrane integrity-associated transporter subunit PqiC [Xanthomonadales bacterium]|jgi:cholesterol transport system auxiliary component|nr:membrane integrity-associated transporter subunit PqiC [Xanthomonadales bacterium]
MSLSRFRLWLPVTAMTLLLAACVSLPDRDDRLAVHTLRVATTEAIALRSPVTLRIDLPLAAPPLDSARLVRRQANGEIGLLSDVRWNQPAPALWQQLLLQHLSDSQGWQAVVTPSSSVRSDVRLSGVLREFDYRTDDAASGAVHITFQAQWIDERSQRVLATQVFSHSERVDREHLAIVEGFQRATDVLLPQVLHWAIEQTANADAPHQ